MRWRLLCYRGLWRRYRPVLRRPSFVRPAWFDFLSCKRTVNLGGHPEDLGMFASRVAPWLTRRGVHYGWLMVALTFLTTVCSSAAISLSGILVLPLIQEFGWGRADIGAVMGLMLLLFAGTAPFAGAIMLRYGLCRTVAVAVGMTLLGLALTMRMTALWQFACGFGVLLGSAAGLLALALPASIANRWFTLSRGLAMSILTAAFAAGQLVFMPTNAWLATHYGWRMALLPVAISCALCLVLYVLFGRDWPADLGLAPYGESNVQRPALGSAGNAIALSFSVLGEAVTTRVFWVLAGTFFICGVSSAGIISQHFIPFCADNGVTAVAAASYLARISQTSTGIACRYSTFGSEINVLQPFDLQSKEDSLF